jgi:hypothetical protein
VVAEQASVGGNSVRKIGFLRLRTGFVGVLASGIIAYVNFFMPIHVIPFPATPSIVLYFFGWPYTAYRNYDSYYDHVVAGFVNNSGGFWGEGTGPAT